MPVTYRLRETPPGLELRLREAAESTIEGDWCVTLSQSHVDGQWYLQLDGATTHGRAVLSTPSASVPQLEALLRRLSALVEPAARLRDAPWRPSVRQAS
jgi:hypothetical protein